MKVYYVIKEGAWYRINREVLLQVYTPVLFTSSGIHGYFLSEVPIYSPSKPVPYNMIRDIVLEQAKCHYSMRCSRNAIVHNLEVIREYREGKNTENIIKFDYYYVPEYYKYIKVSDNEQVHSGENRAPAEG